MTTIQERLKAQLVKSGLPYKRIDCYGSQIVVTAWSLDAAKKWANLLAKFATVRGIVESMDETKDDSEIRKANPGLVKSKFFHPVWVVGARV